jgi:hypothetical protein
MREDLVLKLIEMLIGSDRSDDKGGKSGRLAESVVGKFVICRSRNEGINAGTVVEMDETGVVLSGVRRIWYYKPKDVSVSWYEGVAVSGLSDDSKVSCTSEMKVIIEDYSLTVCADAAKKSIMGKTPNGQN